MHELNNSAEEENKPLANLTENYDSQLSEAESILENSEEETADFTDYSGLDRNGIIARAEEQINATDTRKAWNNLQRLKEAHEALLQAEIPSLIKEWTEAGNDPRDFKPQHDDKRKQFNEIINRFRQKREEEKKRSEEEKVANLKKKKSVLEKMKVLVEGEETEESRNEIRELQRQWKEIRHIPKEFKDELNESYKFILDKFYDNLTMFNELKDLDREKNLSEKIELIKKVEQLKDETNIRRALITLHKFHEDWKNIGPVRKEISEEIWQRFKLASDAVINDKKAKQEERQKFYDENYEIKKMMAEKAAYYTMAIPGTLKEWQEAAKEMDTLLEQWKQIGPVSSDQNEEVWGKFSKARNEFFAARREFFNTLNASRNENIKIKTVLCEKAEALMNSEDFAGTTEALNQLQAEWKKSGPVPESHNQALWGRFRAAFDKFYERKNKHYESKKAEEQGAITKKEEVIARMQQLDQLTDVDEVFKQLRECQQLWVQAGFVSSRNNAPLHKKYQELNEHLFTKFKRSSDEMKAGVMKEHYQTLSSAPDGFTKLKSEERKVRDRINKLNDEIATLERNLGFFANSKNADLIRKEYEGNIKKAKDQIARLEKELKVIKEFTPQRTENNRYAK